MIPVQAVGVVAVIGIAYYLGVRERSRLVAAGVDFGSPGGGTRRTDRVGASRMAGTDDEEDYRRPRLFWVNLVLMVGTVAFLISAVLPPELVFMIGLVAVLLINHPDPRVQIDLIQRHAGAPVLIASILLASGVFLGISTETGMFEAIAAAIAGVLPEAAAPLLPLVVGALSTPASIVLENNAYYFGMLPILADVGEGAGIAPETMARASMIGMYTVGFPLSPLTASFYLLVGLAGVRIGAHIRHMLPWACLVGLVMLAAAVAFGQIPLYA